VAREERIAQMEAKIAKDRAELDELRFALNDVKDTIAGAKQMKEFNDNKADQKGEELDIMKADVFRNKEMVADMEQHGKEALEEIDKVNVDIDALKAQIETLYVGAAVLRRCCYARAGHSPNATANSPTPPSSFRYASLPPEDGDDRETALPPIVLRFPKTAAEKTRHAATADAGNTRSLDEWCVRSRARCRSRRPVPH